MSRFSEKQEILAENKEKDRFVKELMAKTAHNMAVVSFTGMVIGCFASVMQIGTFDMWHFVIAVGGLLLTIFLILIGNYIGRK